MHRTSGVSGDSGMSVWVYRATASPLIGGLADILLSSTLLLRLAGVNILVRKSAFMSSDVMHWAVMVLSFCFSLRHCSLTSMHLLRFALAGARAIFIAAWLSMRIVVGSAWGAPSSVSALRSRAARCAAALAAMHSAPVVDSAV